MPLASYLRAEDNTIREVLTALAGSARLGANKLGARPVSVCRVSSHRCEPEHGYTLD